MKNIVKMTSRKFLIRDMARNIELGTNKCYQFNGYSFFRDGEDAYKIFDEDDNDIGTFDIGSITENFLKMRIKSKSLRDKKPKGLVSRPRKKKRYDIITNDFMLFIKHQKCLVDGCRNEDVEAHHIYGRQPARHDILCVPLCAKHHRGSEFSVHEGNVRDFRKKYPRDVMEQVSLDYLDEWTKDNHGIDTIFREIFHHLKNTKERHTKAIKEFLIGRRNTK